MPRFERDDEFWQIEREGRVVRVRSGRIGDPGQEQGHTHAFEDEAMCDFDDRIVEKTKEGFLPIEQPREQLLATDPVLEAAVVEALAPERLTTPEGVATLRAAWSVLGDWFSALGDVRGELISLDETLADVTGLAVNRLLKRRDTLLATWIPNWFGKFGRLDGPDRPIHLAWDHGFVTAARIGTEPGELDLTRWQLSLSDLVTVLETLLSHPLMLVVQQLRIAELDPHSRRELSRFLPALHGAHRPALLRLELGGVSRGDWVRDATGGMTQRVTLAKIGSLAPLALASRWAPRLAALRVIGRDLRVFPPLPQLRVLELQVPLFDEELRGWLIGGPWPRLERLWLRSTNLADPWADGGGEQLDELLDALQASPLRELGLQGPTALDRLVWRAVSAPLRLEELRLFGLGEGSVDPLLDASDYFDGVGRIVLEDTQISRRWSELQRRYGARLHRSTETFGVVGDRTGDMLTESLFDAPGWKA
jgi:predicted DNA-binding WGR domain protein